VSSVRPRRERRQACIPSSLPRSHIKRFGYVAEIISDRRTGLHYCIIQPAGSREIIWLGQCASAADARRIALRRLHELVLASEKTAGD
jgi:hypothetical protein